MNIRMDFKQVFIATAVRVGLHLVRIGDISGKETKRKIQIILMANINAT
jgi:hypothetical protein